MLQVLIAAKNINDIWSLPCVQTINKGKGTTQVFISERNAPIRRGSTKVARVGDSICQDNNGQWYIKRAAI